MMQVVRPFLSTNVFAKVNMPSTFSGLAKNGKIIFWEIDNYYDFQRLENDNKVSVAVTFLKNHMLQWWTT